LAVALFRLPRTLALATLRRSKGLMFKQVLEGLLQQRSRLGLSARHVLHLQSFLTGKTGQQLRR
jgi:hypothetical protein